jgi:hypothetical protein
MSTSDANEATLSHVEKHRLFCRPDQFSRNSYVNDNNCLLVSSLSSLFYMMSSHRDIYI